MKRTLLILFLKVMARLGHSRSRRRLGQFLRSRPPAVLPAHEGEKRFLQPSVAGLASAVVIAADGCASERGTPLRGATSGVAK